MNPPYTILFHMTSPFLFYIDKPPGLGVVVPAAGVVQPCCGVVDVAPVPQGINPYVLRAAVFLQRVAPRVIGIMGNDVSAFVRNPDDVSLQVQLV